MGEVKKINYIHYFVVLAFCFGFRFLPPFAGITEYGMGVLGPFIGAIYGWVFIDLAWPSIVAILATAITVGMDTMITACLGNTTFAILLFCALAIGPAVHYGAFTWLAMKILSMKALEGKGYLILFTIFIVAWLLACANSFVIAMIVMAFVTDMFKQVGVKKNDKLAIFTYLGVAYQVMRGQILFPFVGTGIIYVHAYQAAMPNQPLEVIPYLTMMGIMGIVMAVIWLLVMKFVFRVDISPLSNYKQTTAVPAATREQKIALGFFAAFIILNLLAAVGPLKPYLSKIGVVGIIFVLGMIMVLIKNDKGEPLLNMEETMRSANMGMAVMIGYVMFLATNLSTPATGVGAAVALLFQPFTSLPPIVFVVVVMIIALVVTNFANNMMVAVVCLPFIINFTSMIGMAPMAAVVLMFIITEFALCTPAASPITALAMSQDLVTTKEVMKYSIPMVAIMFVAFLLIGWPLANFIFG